MNYPEFFRTITGHTPFPYQVELATTDFPVVLDIPTGLGKTAAAVIQADRRPSPLGPAAAKSNF